MSANLIGKVVNVIAKWTDTKAGRVRKCHAVILVGGEPIIVMARQESDLLATLQTPGLAEAYAACISEADRLDKLFNGALAHRPANKSARGNDAPASKSVSLDELRKEASALEAKPATRTTRKAAVLGGNGVTAPQPTPRA